MSDRIQLVDLTRRLEYIINGRSEVTSVWVIAELSEFRLNGRHAYGSLIQKDEHGATIASMRATIWQHNLHNIKQKFFLATGQAIQPGMKVSLQVTANFNSIYGISANVTDIDPTYTLGDMERIRREILERLQREGLYDRNKGVVLSPNPQRIAIISAAGAAGYGDFMQQLNASDFALYTTLYSAVMQGERTPATVMHALDLVEMAPDFWDCVVIIRGGGASSDLNTFDNYELARRVATFPIPVIVGIGHERDNTVLDYIAHTRCKTPTAVAAFLIDRLTAADTRADNAMRRVAELTRNMLRAEFEHLATKQSLIPLLAPRRIDRENHRLDNLRAAILHVASDASARQRRMLQAVAGRIGTAAASAISRASAEIDSFGKTLRPAIDARLQAASAQLDNTAKMIAVLSPEATMKRGYSITRIDGKAIRSVKDIPKGALITTTFPNGSIESKTL